MTISTLPFGRLDHPSTRALFGAAALGHVSQDEADRVLDVLLEYGINHIDVAASYGDAELRIAPWLKRYPDHFFVATKTDQRTAQAGKDQLHRSLDRLGVFELPALVKGRKPNRQHRVAAMTTTGGGAASVVDRIGTFGVDVVGRLTRWSSPWRRKTSPSANRASPT